MGARLSLNDVPNGLGRTFAYDLSESTAAPAGDEASTDERGLAGAAVAGDHDEGLAAQELEKSLGLLFAAEEQVGAVLVDRLEAEEGVSLELSGPGSVPAEDGGDEPGELVG